MHWNQGPLSHFHYSLGRFHKLRLFCRFFIYGIDPFEASTSCLPPLLGNPPGAFELMKIVSFRCPTQEPDLTFKFFFWKRKKKGLDSNIDQALEPRPCKPFSSEPFTRSSELFILKHFHIKRYSICISLSELDTSGSNAPPPGTDNGQMPTGCTGRGVWKLRLHRRIIPVDVQKPY